MLAAVGEGLGRVSLFCRKPIVMLLAGTASAAAIANYCFNQDSNPSEITALNSFCDISFRVLSTAASLTGALYTEVMKRHQQPSVLNQHKLCTAFGCIQEMPEVGEEICIEGRDIQENTEFNGKIKTGFLHRRFCVDDEGHQYETMTLKDDPGGFDYYSGKVEVTKHKKYKRQS